MAFIKKCIVSCTVDIINNIRIKEEFRNEFKVELAEKILMNSPVFSLKELIIELLSAERGERALKLFFMCLASFQGSLIFLLVKQDGSHGKTLK